MVQNIDEIQRLVRSGEWVLQSGVPREVYGSGPGTVGEVILAGPDWAFVVSAVTDSDDRGWHGECVAYGPPVDS
jgi:hypothetical protein